LSAIYILDDYELESKPLGKGAFGTVYRAMKDKKFFAIKVFEYSTIEEEDAAMREMS
jgi:serine/threonine-protein kinase RIO1